MTVRLAPCLALSAFPRPTPTTKAPATWNICRCWTESREKRGDPIIAEQACRTHTAIKAVGAGGNGVDKMGDMMVSRCRRISSLSGDGCQISLFPNESAVKTGPIGMASRSGRRCGWLPQYV